MTERAQARSAAQAPWWRRLLGLDRAARARLARARGIYAGLVALAREEIFYREHAVPDSADGRFEMIGLHVILAIRHLRRQGDEGRALAQALFDVMFADMDRSLREMGVGDLSVGKHVKHLAQTFLARAEALKRPLAAGDAAAILPVLLRNVYQGGAAPRPEQVELLAQALLARDRALAGLAPSEWEEVRIAAAAGKAIDPRRSAP